MQQIQIQTHIKSNSFERIKPTTITTPDELILPGTYVNTLLDNTKKILSLHSHEGQAQAFIILIKSIHKLIEDAEIFYLPCGQTETLLVRLLNLTQELNDKGNFQYLDLSGQDLTDMDFSPKCLRWKSGKQPVPPITLNMSHAKFNGANLELAIFDEVNLNEAKFVLANMHLTRLIKAEAQYADFTRAKMRKANLSEIKANGAIFAEADLYLTNIKDGDLSDTDCTGTRFIGTNLSGAILDRVSNHNAIMSGIIRDADNGQRRQHPQCCIIS